MEFSSLTVAYISIISGLIPISIGLKKYKTFDTVLKLILWMLIVSFGIDILSYYAAKIFKNSMGLVNIYAAIQLIFISIIYQRFFSKKRKNILYFLSTLTLLFIFWEYFFRNGLYELKELSIGLGNLMCIIYLLGYFGLILIGEQKSSLNDETLLWISSGILMFIAGSSVVVAGYKIVSLNKSIMNLYMFNWITRMIMNIFIFIGFYYYKGNSTMND